MDGEYCRILSTTVDQNIQRSMGTRSLEEFVDHMMLDAASPEQFDALAFQLLCVGRRVKTIGLKDAAKRWKDASRRATSLAEEARARVAALPNDPALINPRTVGKPNCLDSDLRLPLFARIDLTGDPFDRAEVMVGSYEPMLRHGVVYRIGGSRLGYTWLTATDTTHPAKVRNAQLRALWSLGRLVPVVEPIAMAA